MAVSPTSAGIIAARMMDPASHATPLQNARHAEETLSAKTANTVRMELTAVTVTKHAMKIVRITCVIDIMAVVQKDATGTSLFTSARIAS